MLGYIITTLKKVKIYTFLILLGLILFNQFAATAQVWKPDYDSARVKFNRGEIEATTAWLEDFLPKFKVAPDIDTVAYYEMVFLLGRCYLKQGFSANAEEMFNDEVEFFKSNPQAATKSSYASSITYLGFMKYGLKKYDDAEAYFKEVLIVKSELKELKKNQEIVILTNLGTIANTNHQYVKADSLYELVINLKKSYNGINSLELAKTYTTKGMLCKKMGRYSEAEAYYKLALDIRKSKQGEKNKEYIYTLGKMGDLYQTQGRYQELEVLLKQIVQTTGATYGLKSLDYCRAINKLTSLYRALSRYKEAEPLCLQVLQIIEDTIGQNNLDYTTAQIEIATLYKEMNQFKQSEIYFLSAISIYEVIVGLYHESYVHALVQLASLYRTVGRTAEAEPLYISALNIYKQTSGSKTIAYADLLNDYGLYFDEMGHYEQAELHYKKSLEITEALSGSNSPNYASTLDNLANHYLLTGHVDQAEPIFIEATRIRKDKLGIKHPLYATSLNNLGNLFETTGRIVEAKENYMASISIIKELYGKNNYIYANAIDNLADVLQKEGDYTQAEFYIQESMKINKALFGEHHPYFTAALNNLAQNHMHQKNPVEAEKLYKENIINTKATVGDEHPSYALALSNLADLCEEQERYKEAEDLYEVALKIRKDKLGVNHRQYTTTLSHLAGLYSATNDFDKADLLWETSLNNYLKEIKLFFPSMSEKEKQQFYKTINSEFEQFNSYALTRFESNPAILSKMYNNQLATKALILNSSNKVRQKILNSRDTSIISDYKNWIQQKAVLSNLYSLSVEEVKRENIDIDSLEKMANQLEKKISLKSGMFKNANDTLTYTWKDVQKKLKDKEAAVEIIRFKKYDFRKSGQSTDSIFYVALIITKQTKNNPDIVIMKDGKDLEKKYLNYYKNVIRFKIPDEFSYTEYWKKIKDKVPGMDKIFFSPDGVYNQLNMNTIKNTETGKFVIEENDIQLVTNTKDLLIQYAVKNTSKRITLLGDPDYTAVSGIYPKNYVENASENKIDAKSYYGILSPLPGTNKEINMIDAMMKEKKWKTTVNIQSDANERMMKSINSPKVLHIATHGFFDKDLENNSTKGVKTETNPRNKLLRSGLMFAGASVSLYNKKNPGNDGMKQLYGKDAEDGILTAYEAMSLNLDSTDLVVLSACETGLGDVENGEGVYGLQRAFIIAGAESIILSLWKVDDLTTQKLMTLFYNEWIKTGNKRQAFRSAQNLVKQQYPDPYYWGAFVMVGN